MRKVLCFLVLLSLCSVNLFAQSPTRTTIKGSICDTAGVSIPSAMVMLLNSKDSMLVNFTQVNDKGEFEFKNLKNSGYLLKISHMSYLPYQHSIPVSTTDMSDLGSIKLKLISKLLMEVVIKAARAPLKFRGDTIEYDASSFKVPPGSTVEDLLRRLPGIEVDADGNIKSQGKSVNRVFVEGKSFFGDDPKFATKNLGAETISKVQVFDEKSEQSKLTGIDDGVKDNKVMNLSLKEQYKKGAFGKLTAAIGDQSRWAARGNYNRFNKTQQLSFIAYGNNISQTGVNWEDYGEFKGQSNNTYDNGDFGFGSTSVGQYISADDGMSGGYNGSGLSKNYGTGVNYNFDNKKTKFNSSYVYNETTRTSDQTSNRLTFLQNSSYKNIDTTSGKDFRGNHTMAVRIEHNIDSTNILISKVNIKFSTSTNSNSSISHFLDAVDVPTRNMLNLSSNNLNSWNITSAVIYRKSFKKKGTNFAWSGGFNSSKSDGENDPYTLNRFFEANTYTDQIISLNINNNNTITQFKSSMLFTETLSKKFFLEAFYNFNSTSNVQNRLTENAALQNSRIDSLTAYYTNDALSNRLGTTLRYSDKGLNATVGVAAERYQIKGTYSMLSDMPGLADPVNKTYFNWTPNLSLRYQLFKSTYLSANYTYSVNEPSVNQLMPLKNINNLVSRVDGNPDLQPQQNHNISLSTMYFNQASMGSCILMFNYRKSDNQIVYNQNITMVDKVGLLTVSKPGNVKGGNSYSLMSMISYPLIKTKLTVSLQGGANFSNSPTFINDVENITYSKGYNFSSSFNLTPNPKLVLGVNGRINFNNITYSFRTEQNQKIRNYTTSYSAKWQFATKSYFESNFDYSIYRNDKYGFNQNIPILNASVRQIFGKTNRIEMRLAAFDIFNRNQSISQGANQNYVYSSRSITIARYFMLSLSYNIKGFETKMKQAGGMF